MKQKVIYRKVNDLFCKPCTLTLEFPTFVKLNFIVLIPNLFMNA